jgi:hypothetical protein
MVMLYAIRRAMAMMRRAFAWHDFMTRGQSRQELELTLNPALAGTDQNLPDLKLKPSFTSIFIKNKYENIHVRCLHRVASMAI